MPRPRRLVDQDLNDELAAALRASRQTITGVAHALGCARSTVYKWFDGTNAIPEDQLLRLCDLLHLSAAQRAAQFAGRRYTLDVALLTTSAFQPPPRELRSPIGDFIGRADTLARAVTVLEHGAASGGRASICGVRGMSGIGKTEFAYMVAHRVAARFPDGQILLLLHGMSAHPTPAVQALQTVIRTFDPAATLPTDLEALQRRYCSELAGRRVLILADDAHDTEQIQPLVPPPGCALLITSRQRVLLPGMVTVDLDPLVPDEAVQFLTHHCSHLGTAAPALAAFCGYLPLALRVSASRLATDDTYPMTQYLVDLETARLAILHDRDAPDDPQASVTASLTLSYRALARQAQQVLAQLSVFPDTFDHAAAQAVLGLSDRDTRQALRQLRQHSLLVWDGVTQRGSLHTLVRLFAATYLGDDADIRTRHASYYLAQAEAIPSDDRPSWLAAMTRDQRHLHGALDWWLQTEQEVLALRLATALGPFWFAIDQVQVGSTYLHAALARVPADHAALRAQALMHAGALARVQGHAAVAQRCYTESRTLFHALHDAGAAADALFQRGLVFGDLGQKHAARAAFQESVQELQFAGRLERAGVVHSSLGRMALDGGDLQAAHTHFATSATMLRASTDGIERAWLCVNQARHASVMGDDRAALRFADEAIHAFRDLRHSQGLAWALLRRGIILGRLAQYPSARVTLTTSLGAFTRVANPAGEAMAHQMLAQLAFMDGMEREAAPHALAALRSYADQANRAGIGFSLILVARTRIAHDRQGASLLLGAVVSLLDSTGVDLQATEYAWYAERVTEMHDQLTQAAEHVAWATGQHWSLGDVRTWFAQEAVGNAFIINPDA